MVKEEQRQPLSKQLEAELSRQVGAKETRKMRARREKHHTIWQGFRMFGLVGWAVAVPTVAGIALGIYLDRRYPGRMSWTLNLLVVGVALGCLYAWHWVQQERAKIHERDEEPLDD